MWRSHLAGIIPRNQLIDLALFMAIYDGGERAGHVGLRIYCVEFAGLDEGGDSGPIFGSDGDFR